MHNPRQTTLPGTGCLTEALELDLHITIVPDETGWAALTKQQAMNVVLEELENLGPGIHIRIQETQS